MKELIIFILLLNIACTQDHSIKRIAAKEAKELIESKTIHIIDVRTDQEYNRGHLKNAKLLNMMSANFSKKIKLLDKNKSYLIYCHSGNRSFKVAKEMADLGFKSVYEMKYGIREWNSMNYEITK